MKKQLTEKQLSALEKGRKIAHLNAKNRKPFLGKKHTEKTKTKISKTNKRKGIKPPITLGRHPKTEWKKGERISRNTEFKKGQEPWNKFLPQELQPNWKGGVSFEPYSKEWTLELKKQIRKRDKYTCQLCKRKEKEFTMKNRNGKIVPLNLCVHHIDYNKLNCNEKNLITLCRKCNILANFERKKWVKYFKEQLL